MGDFPDFTPPTWVAPEPPTSYRGAYVVVEKDGQEADRILIGTRPYTLFGRNGAMAHVQLDHDSISRRHAGLFWNNNGELCVMDLGSSHGTFVNDKVIPERTPVPLHMGDVVRFAHSSRQYRVVLSSLGKRPAPDTAQGDSASAAAAEPTKVQCLHILRKHKGSRRPSSWRQAVITCTRDEAAAELAEWRERMLSGAVRFEDVARTQSDCNSAKRGGDLGFFERGKMQPPFERVAFALRVGEVSGLVDTDSGVHIIKRIA